jgi:ribonuclease J
MALNFNEYNSDVLFVPLGGSNEIGMNLNLYRYQGKWLMVDFGIGFANDYLAGVEVIVPDTAFVEEIRKDIVGLVLTHAHEDHLGAVPYLWEDITFPVYATPFTASVLKLKLERERITLKAPINEVQLGSRFKIGSFDVELVSITHSIPEMQAVAIHTPQGVIMHTGDWKLDATPMLGEITNETRLKEMGDKGVLAIVCDSTNVFVEGRSGSEGDVRKELTEMIRHCPERVVVTTFASNVARLESIILAAVDAGRRIALAGRSLERMIAAAQDSGYLKDIPEMLDEKSAMGIPRNECLIICTGCQGEPRAALTKIARREHPFIRLAANDTVIFSSRDIPGNQSRIGYTHNLLVGQGVEVLTSHSAEIHVSGHPAKEELVQMYQMLRPQIAVPTHGEPRHLHEHAKLAKNLGVAETIEAENGAVILLSKGQAQQIGRVDSGYIAVDGNSLVATSSPIFSQRRRMRDNGIVLIALALQQADLMARPVLIAPGVLDNKLDRDLFEEITDAVEDAVQETLKKKGMDLRQIEESVRGAARKIIRSELGKRPLVEVAISQI